MAGRQAGVHPQGAGAEAQHAPLLLLHVGEDVLQVQLLPAHRLSKGQHELACTGQRQRGFPVEQLHAVVFLQTLDVVAEGLLGDEQTVGGTGHM